MSHILVNGASNCTGYGNPDLANWPAMLAERTGCVITNIAKDGASLDHVLRTTHDALASHSFDGIIIVAPWVVARREFILDDDLVRFADVMGPGFNGHLTPARQRQLQSLFAVGNDWMDVHYHLRTLHHLGLLLAHHNRPFYLTMDVYVADPKEGTASPEVAQSLSVLRRALGGLMAEKMMFEVLPLDACNDTQHPNALGHAAFADHLVETFFKPNGLLA